MSNARKPKAAVSRETGPEVLGRGRYAIYQDANGDGIVSYRPEGSSEDSHQVVPARIWTVILGVLRGEITDMNPMILMKTLMGAGK